MVEFLEIDRIFCIWVLGLETRLPLGRRGSMGFVFLYLLVSVFFPRFARVGEGKGGTAGTGRR